MAAEVVKVDLQQSESTLVVKLMPNQVSCHTFLHLNVLRRSPGTTVATPLVQVTRARLRSKLGY
jgi:hypothetical protein